MPVVDGLEATKRIKDLPGCDDVPIIAMTAHVAEEDRKRCFEAGMCDYVAKPIEKSALFATISRWLPSPEPSRVQARPSQADGSMGSVLDTESFVANWRDLDHDTRAEIITIFRNECQNRVAHLQRGDLDRATATREAHSLKSASANVGALALSEAAANLEHAFDAGDDVQPVLQRVVDIAEKTLIEVDRVQADETYWRQGEGV